MTMQPDTMDKLARIRAVMRDNPQGIWMDEIARRADINDGSIRYFILGQTKNGKFYGGYLRDSVEAVALEGRNLKLRLKA